MAVETALGGFVQLAARSRGERAQTPTAAAVDGAYQLGRGEARSGRTVDALLSAYRIGARVSWREMSSAAVRTGVDADTLARFAELVFAYIEQLSAASLAGHNDELETTGRVRQRLLERLAEHLLDGSPPEAVVEAAAERADWTPPQHADGGDRARSRRCAPCWPRSPAETLQATEALPPRTARGWRCCSSPTSTAARRSALLQDARAAAVRWPARPGRGLRGARVLRPGPARTTPRARHRTARSTSPSWC